jgi:DNA mismatch repair protein MutS2
MTKSPRFLQVELEGVEFPALVALIADGTRTRLGREAILRMTPWDRRNGLRRLRQRELAIPWAAQPSTLPVLCFDEALDELLSPAGWLLPEHWRQLRMGLAAMAVLLRSIASLTWAEAEAVEPGTHAGIDLLQVTAQLLPDPGAIVDRLARCFMEDGQLDPMRIPELASLHRERQRSFQSIQNRLQKILKEVPEACQEPNIVERNGRFCLPLRQERRGMVPGLVLDRSSSGATVFVEPLEAVGLNNEFVEADREYTQAVQAFLRELLDSLRARRNDFERWHRFQGDVDETLAFLRWQGLCEGTLAALGGPRLRLIEARHPLLLPAVRSALELDFLDHEVIPLSLDLEAERPGLVISGSNTGGKTVVMKTVGLLMALAQSGCAIPAAEGSEMPTLTSLHADIGDHQTLIGSLSTFSSHILHLKQILDQAKPGGLVLLDELGTSTDPKEGAALGISVLQALARRRCWVLCSTHLGEISRWAMRHSRFQNASVQFDEERLAPTYRLLVGMPGQSRALTIAAKLGLPRFILDQAEKVLGKQEQDWREFLKQLEADRLRLLEEAATLKTRQAALEKDQRILSEREEALRRQQEKLQLDTKEKVQRVLDFIDHESKRLVKELKDKQKSVETFSADRVGMEARERVKTIGQIATAELSVGAMAPAHVSGAPAWREGAYARHRGLGVEGKITSLKGDRATLQTVQGRRMEARLGELEPITRTDADMGAYSGRVRVRAQSTDIDSEINLIGRASDDVDFEIHRFVEESLSAGQKFIRIVHGHGTGRLKAAVREALKGHPGISKVEDAPQNQGGAGATVITLR